MFKDILSLTGYLRGDKDPVDKQFSSQPEDRNYSSAITLGSTAMGGNRSFGATKGGTFDYLSTAENTIDCYYQKIEDLKYYEAHDLTEKVVGLFRDYINQLWKEGSDLIDIPGEEKSIVEAMNAELEGMDILEILTKDLDDVIYYGSVSYAITDSTNTIDPNDKTKDKSPGKDTNKTLLRNLDHSIDPPSDRKYTFGDLRESKYGDEFDYYRNISTSEDKEFARESAKAKAARIIDANAPSVKKILDDTNPSVQRGTKESLREDGDFKTASHEGPADAGDKIGNIRSRVPYKSKFKLNKLKFPHHTVVEHDRKEGRRYLIRANKTYHIPETEYNIFYYGNDSMRITEDTGPKQNGKQGSKDIFDIINSSQATEKQKKEEKRLGIDPKDPKKKPTKYELLERELSAAVPLFYHHLPKVRELYLKDLVLSILGIKDVIQPDILAMNFEGGMDIDQAQDMCNNLEDLLNKNSDYSIFNSAALDYNQLVKLLVDTVRVLPDIEGKIQSLQPVRTTTLQDKMQQIRGEYQELNRNIISALGVPMDLFEGNSSKWEVIKRSERLQSKVNYHINTIKMSVRRLAQAVFYKLYNRELKLTDFKVTIFNKSDLEIAAETNRLQSLNELSQTLIQIVSGAERELQESRLVNKRAYYNLLKSNLKEIYPEIEDLIDVDKAMGGEDAAVQPPAEPDMDQYQ